MKIIPGKVTHSALKQWTEKELKECAYTNHGSEYYLTGNLPKDRMGMIYKYLMDNGPLMPGNRHNVIHLAYNYAVQCMSEEDAVKAINDINSEFVMPLRQGDINDIIRCHNRRKSPYKYKLDNFLEKLNVTYTVIKRKYHTGKNYLFRQKLKQDNKVKKQNRNRKIIQEYVKIGTFTGTAKKCRVCINTVKSVIRANSGAVERFKRQFRREADRLAFSNFCKYKDINKAAKKGKCSVTYLNNLVDKYTSLRKNLYVILKDLDEQIPNQVWKNKEKYGKFFKQDYLFIERLLADYTGIDNIDINIALAPYIRVER